MFFWLNVNIDVWSNVIRVLRFASLQTLKMYTLMCFLVNLNDNFHYNIMYSGTAIILMSLCTLQRYAFEIFFVKM